MNEGRPAAGRLNVMLVTHDLGIGGLPRMVTTLARNIDSSRFAVSVLCMRETGPLARELEQSGVPVHRVPSPRQPDRLAALRVVRILREQGVDVLHTHNTQPFLEAGLAGVLVGVKRLVHTDHGREYPDRRRYMWAERIMSRFAYKVVGVSEATSEQLIRWEKIAPEKVMTIENGLDERPFLEAEDGAVTRIALGLPQDAPLIGTVARLEREKGVDILIEAMRRIVDRHPMCRCLIIGYGAEEDRLRARAEELQLGDRVLFLGARTDVPNLLRALDCHVLPSRREGLPLVVLEAMAAGCPVVAARVGGVPAALPHGRAGVIVEPEDPEALADAVASLLASPSRRRAYAEEASRLFRERFSAHRMTRRYERLYSGEEDCP